VEKIESLREAFFASWPYIYSWVALILGVGLFSYVARSTACGYIYPDIKYEFAERNRVYKDDDPFWFWFFVVLYGCASILLFGVGSAALLRLYFQ